MQTLPGIVPLYTAVEMRTVDRIAVEEVGLPAAVLMERAGLGAAERGGNCGQRLAPEPAPSRRR